ncbi:uncharacterized protein FFB14_10812 [Fusarium fujikuroi]|nr:uncharacterized protein FFB14_10812 [Fusarium fujikuroi]
MTPSKAASHPELVMRQRQELAHRAFRARLMERHRRRLEASKFWIKLEGQPDTIEAVAQAVGIASPNGRAISATDSSGNAGSFLEINAINKTAIEMYLREIPSLINFIPTFIPRNPAKRNLSSHSPHSMLNIESTLPDRRLAHLHDEPRPEHIEYPVGYFVEGDLADVAVLFSLLGCEPQLRPAVAAAGFLKGGQSLAMSNDPNGTRVVSGKALLVETEAQEDMLRVYQSNAYEVVRCPIELGEEDIVDGFAFRFIE